MFPKNWDIKRIQEEVAYVYDLAQNERSLIKLEPTAIKFGKIEGETSSGFKILIEIDKHGSIMNACPKI